MLRRTVYYVHSRLERCEQLGNFFWWVLKVIIHRYTQRVACQTDARQKCIVLPVIAHHVERHQVQMGLHLLLYPRPGIVAAAIVDQDYLVLAHDVM